MSYTLRVYLGAPDRYMSHACATYRDAMRLIYGLEALTGTLYAVDVNGADHYYASADPISCATRGELPVASVHEVAQ